MYLRGPLILGESPLAGYGVCVGDGLWAAIDEGYNFINGRPRNDEPILLTGYSRGAAGVIEIAKRLKVLKRDVTAMLLFDCVDRHLGIDAARIPNNVRNVLHVLRSPASGSRKSFDHSGTQPEPPTRYESAEFTCTHAGMGGVPWPRPAEKSQNDFIDEGLPDGRTNVTYYQDGWMSNRVWTHVKPFVGKHGF
jgi:hypothetical protein